jgi:transposase
MSYPQAAWERAMTVQEVVLKALSGEIHWFRAADILGMSPRTLRRWRERYERHGYVGLVDKRRHTPSVRRIAAREVERLLRLYRERYRGFNVRHFHEIARREHGVRVSYSFLKQTLQAAGLVTKHRARGRHRRRREPKACFGELLHIDGSTHPWFALAPETRATLIAVPDDATNQVLCAQLWEAESTRAVMTALGEVFTTYGLPMALYSDRAHWAFHTPTAKGPIDKTHVTQVGRALAQLGVDHIPSYSPQARGRSERLNRTVQDRLVNELRLAGIVTIPEANVYLRDVFLPHHNASFAHPPRDPEPAWVTLGDVDLDQILCHQEARTVAPDNTVAMDRLALQIAKQPGRRTCAGLVVIVRRHLSGQYSIWRGTQRFGLYDAGGQPVDAAAPMHGRTSRPRTSRLDRPQTAGPPRPQAVSLALSEKRSDHLSNASGQFTCQ